MKKKVIILNGSKLEAYKQAKADKETARLAWEALRDEANEIGYICVTNNLTITHRSSKKEFLFAIGVTKSNVDACKELGEDPTDLKENLKSIKRLFQLGKELSQWKEYYDELERYYCQVERLLSDDDRFALLEYPSKK